MVTGDERSRWCSETRLLLRSGLASGRRTAPLPRLLPVWRAAHEQAGEQLDRLQTALRRTGKPLARELADKGLHGLTRRLQVGLHVALTEFDASAGEARASSAAKLQAAVAEMSRFVTTDPLLPVLERNPFGVSITIRSSLLAALGAIATELRRS